MPIYEYECAKCGNVFEQIQKISDPPPKTCPKCGGRKVSKLLSGSAFVFKGSGFYATDYKGGNGSGTSARSGSSKSSSNGNGDGAGESSTKSKSSCKGCSSGDCSSC